MRISLARIKLGRFAKSILLLGLRGVGKTVLLDQILMDAEESGIHTVRIEAPEQQSLPAMLAPALHIELLRLSRAAKAKDVTWRALQALAGFAGALKVTYQDIEIGLDADPEKGLADNGDLATDLSALLQAAGEAAKQESTALVLFIDELQYVREAELAALITALHRCAQKQLPVTLVGAGLPQLRGKMGEAKSYAERFFEFPEMGPLNRESCGQALVIPARLEGVEFEEAALERIFDETKGYPYFIQEWGKHSWDVASRSPITFEDVVIASKETIAALDESFFRVRFDRLTPLEKDYMKAMSVLGKGPHRSGDIAARMNKEVTRLAPIRSGLITKGMIYSPSHGETAITVPLFDEFILRVMP